MSHARRLLLLMVVMAPCLQPLAKLHAETGQSTRVADPKQHLPIGTSGYPYREKADYVLKELDLKPGDVVVDIGAGDGWWSERMAKYVGAGGTIHAAEVEQKLVDKMKEKFAGTSQVKPYLCKKDSVELPENSCDLAFLSQTFHHLGREGRVEYLRRLRKVVKPTGRFCVVEKYSEIAAKSKDHGTQLSRVLQECEEAGWIPVRCELITGTEHYLAMFVQKDLFQPETATRPAVAATPAATAPIEAAVRTVDITPPVGYRLSGYYYERPSTGTHDPLMAKAIVLCQGDQQAAMVFCDLIGIPWELTQRVRRLVEQKTGIPQSHVLIAATHSHTGPLFSGTLRKQFHEQATASGGADPREKEDYAATLAEKLVQVIADGRAAVKPMKLLSGIGKQPGLSFNRRFHMKDGSVRFNPGKLNPDIVRPAGPIDPDVGIVLLRAAADNRPVASLCVFALHLDTVGGTEYSADYPGYLQLALRQKLGEGFVSLFGNGTCGDINHIDVSHARRQQGQEEAKRIGETLAATVQAQLAGLKDVTRPALAVRSEVLEVPLQQFTAEELAWAQQAVKKVGTRELPFLEGVKACKIVDLHARGVKSLPMQVQVFRLGDDVAVVGLPGEVFVELGLAIKRASPFATTLVVELANDAPAYVPTRKAFGEGSYETVNSRIQSGGGELLVETAGKLLKQLKEQLP